MTAKYPEKALSEAVVARLHGRLHVREKPTAVKKTRF